MPCTYSWHRLGAVDIFCGKDNCYDIIGVPKTSSLDDIKKV